VGYSKFCWNY